MSLTLVLLTYTILDPIILSEDESICINSKINYSISNIYLILESEASCYLIVNNKRRDSKGLYLATTRLFCYYLFNN